MTGLQIVFIIAGAITLISAVLVVISRNLVHAALWLILALAGVAVLFVLLEAGFLAIVQVAVYIDAIAILIIVTVMLTRHAMRVDQAQLNRTWLWAALSALILFGGILLIFNQIPTLNVEPVTLVGTADTTLENLGQSLVDVDQYVIPFEIASVLLLAALIGAIFVARPPIRKVDAGGEE
jgi:NADH-quinone oxidoreductase subunit J